MNENLDNITQKEISKLKLAKEIGKDLIEVSKKFKRTLYDTIFLTAYGSLPRDIKQKVKKIPLNSKFKREGTNFIFQRHEYINEKATEYNMAFETVAPVAIGALMGAGSIPLTVIGGSFLWSSGYRFFNGENSESGSPILGIPYNVGKGIYKGGEYLINSAKKVKKDFKAYIDNKIKSIS